MGGDAEFSPRPSDDKLFEWRKRRAACFNGRYVEVKDFWFFTYDVGLFHGYLGYAPVSLADEKFIWATLERVVSIVEKEHPPLWVNWQVRPLGFGAW